MLAVDNILSIAFFTVMFFYNPMPQNALHVTPTAILYNVLQMSCILVLTAFCYTCVYVLTSEWPGGLGQVGHLCTLVSESVVGQVCILSSHWLEHCNRKSNHLTVSSR